MDTTSHNFDPTDDPMLTAYALGELEGADLAAVERLLAQEPGSRVLVDEVRQTAAWLSEGFKGEPDVGLTAIHVAGIERQLARHSEFDAPQPEVLPLRRNWGLWGSVAASTLIVATVMASVLPRVFQESHHGQPGGAGTGGNANPSASAAASSGGSGGLIVSSSPGGPIGKLTAPGNDLLVSDWPILRTSAGGLPWPSAASQTNFSEPAFVGASDFPIAVIPPSPRRVPGKGSLSAIESSLAAGQLPSPQSVRADELVNALQYEVSPAQNASPVSTVIETAICPWNSAHLLVRVTVRTSGQPGAAPGMIDSDSLVPFVPEIVPLIRDLHLVVEVNPAAAAVYRVLGYENGPRSWGEWSGRNESEVVAPGTTFTTLLEIVPIGRELPETGKPIVLRRYAQPEPAPAASDDLLTVSVVYSQGPASTPASHDQAVKRSAGAIEQSSPDFQAAAGAAALGLSLRHVNPPTDPLLETSIKLLANVAVTAPAADRQNLLDLARKVKAMGR